MPYRCMMRTSTSSMAAKWYRNRLAKANPRSYARWHKIPNEDDEDGTVAAGKRSVTLANLPLCNHYTTLQKIEKFFTSEEMNE